MDGFEGGGSLMFKSCNKCLHKYPPPSGQSLEDVFIATITAVNCWMGWMCLNQAITFQHCNSSPFFFAKQLALTGCSGMKREQILQK